MRKSDTSISGKGITGNNVDTMIWDVNQEVGSPRVLRQTSAKSIYEVISFVNILQSFSFSKPTDIS